MGGKRFLGAVYVERGKGLDRKARPACQGGELRRQGQQDPAGREVTGEPLRLFIPFKIAAGQHDFCRFLVQKARIIGPQGEPAYPQVDAAAGPVEESRNDKARRVFKMPAAQAKVQPRRGTQAELGPFRLEKI